MALNIKDQETDRLARELSAATGQTITVAVREAIKAQLAVVQQRNRRAQRNVLTDVIERGRARAFIDHRSANEILGYDDDGLPS
ncbi:MAG: type II toxin-antitoxin system VapB family antitoxin [Acidimicrobiia bacterium]|nr:type II toxin-antitoxin system VapB family antitoxin [Acidimicrobiia bacterium]